ncbi:hypothetical protein LINPERHAP2_LOCUS8588 [Linum perenne]
MFAPTESEWIMSRKDGSSQDSPTMTGKWPGGTSRGSFFAPPPACFCPRDDARKLIRPYIYNRAQCVIHHHVHGKEVHPCLNLLRSNQDEDGCNVLVSICVSYLDFT